jgi:hypothetical protein
MQGAISLDVRPAVPGRLFLLFVLFLFISGATLSAQTTVLHLKNGDRVAGLVLTQDTNSIVISNAWIKQLSIPLSEITSREQIAAPAVTAASTTNPPTAAANPPLAGTGTNATPAKAAALPPVAKAVPAKKPKHWKGELRLGASFLSAAKDQEIYYGRFKLQYEQPYEANPKKFFRNSLDYSADYGKTDGVLSANRMEGSDKTDFDVGARQAYVYNLARVGYDEIRRLDLYYEEGPGVGYHLMTRTNFVLNAETGFNYQFQDRADQTTSDNFYLRVGEDFTWKALKQMTLTEKFEFFPRISEFDQYRMRFESTLSYGIWQNVSLNLTVLDLYDTQPAATVPNNDIQFRTSLGITF